MNQEDFAALAARLDDSPDHRVLRRLTPRKQFTADVGGPLRRGVVLDTETTALDPSRGKIIEIGLVAFDYRPDTGQPVRVTGAYGGLEDPGHPLSAEIVEITGITDSMLAGQRIDETSVASLVGGASIVIAHNAEFDRPFFENRFPSLNRLPWGCSMIDIDWNAEKLGSRKLDYIAFQLGFFFDAHRAEEDCHALLEILALPLPISRVAGLKPVIDRLANPAFTVLALNSPFATKDLLKGRQYRWNAEDRIWYRTVQGTDMLAAEYAWLKANVYGGCPARIEVIERDAWTRFSRCPVSRQEVTL